MSKISICLWSAMWVGGWMGYLFSWYPIHRHTSLDLQCGYYLLLLFARLTCGRLRWTLLGWCPSCRYTWAFCHVIKIHFHNICELDFISFDKVTFIHLIWFCLMKTYSTTTNFPLKFICWILRINFIHLGQVLLHVCFNDNPSTFISFSGFYIRPHSSNTGCTLLRKGRKGEIFRHWGSSKDFD